MPMFDFECPSCGNVFEELVFEDEIPACPKCGAATEKRVSAPSPLKTGAFPFKIGPVHPGFKAMQQNASSCGGSCSSCG